ncbi:succinylglutamate desuccinylase/aspartoacylase domain-containing protein [Aliamphritea hakodatensis]|uniref:succinylglutamate desuccinylase/aspartoacylase domain-containing protein n=1 Tax=Aliamphritea hakodatensis TaxID=2895352 RepID=UPI0022FD984B|nr:succinylglutamate desuccinylase/aspartoacylase family protein [Aliamphritea hakodatensis]
MTIPPCRFSIAASDAPIELLPRDLSAYREGNCGVDYVHCLDSGIPGPSITVVALNHGNELCGANALCYLLDNGIMPVKGDLTLVFANIEAYQTFDPQRPFASRCQQEDMNRLWNASRLIRPDSPDCQRAAEIEAFIANADHLLDLHSTTHPVCPMLIYPDTQTNHDFGNALEYPFPKLYYRPEVYHNGLLINYHQQLHPDAISVVAECGQHFSKAATAQAISTTLRFIRQFDMLDPALELPEYGYDNSPHAGEYRIHQVLNATSDHFSFTDSVLGFERYGQGQTFAHDAGNDLQAPFDNCTLIMPARVPVMDEEAVTLAEFVA